MEVGHFQLYMLLMKMSVSLIFKIKVINDLFVAVVEKVSPLGGSVVAAVSS